MAVRRIRTEEMTVAWFHRLPDHPRQRDTVRHARKAVKHHLAKRFITQEEVSVVRVKGGPWQKLDGHSRDFLWHTGQLEPPYKLFVTRYECDTQEESNQLYLAHNNRHAAENPSDLAFGRLRELGMVEISKALSYQAANTSRILFQFQSGLSSWPDDLHIEAMDLWRPQFEAFNEGLKNKTRFKYHSAFTVAEFITHRKYGAEESDLFWDKFHRKDGVYLDRQYDSVHALWYVYNKKKHGGISRVGTRGSDNTATLAAVSLRYFEGYRKDRWYVRPTVALRDSKFAYKYVQEAFGRIVVPNCATTNVSKNADVVEDTSWLKSL